ncbi:MAG: hypothetical protein GY832_04255 [Chloroflexi bacterium]|nr:hypothetical protein [Chloroflexota bacterium]
MKRLKQLIIIATLVAALISCGRSSPPPPKLTIELSNLTLCQGWNTENEPISFPDTVPPGETSLCICGQLETNRGDVTLQISWYRDRSKLARNPQLFSNGLFLSCIEEEESFDSGDYIVRVIAGKTEIGRVEFIVGEE